MDFPDDVLLNMIQKRHIYADKKSLEKSTGIIKKKYKLALTWPESLKSQNLRMFFVSTSRSSSVSHRTSVKIESNDYECCSLEQLRSGTSFYDISKREILTHKEILEKMRDPENRFSDVATIKDSSFAMFLNAADKLHLSEKPPLSVQDLININKSIVDEDLEDERLRELHLL